MSKDDEGALDPVDEQVVEILLRTDRLLEQYKRRKRNAGEDLDFDQPSLTDRLLIAQIINQTAMAGAMGVGTANGLSPEKIFSQIDSLRERLFEELKAHIDEIMTSPIKTGPMQAFKPVPVMPSQEELKILNAELEADGSSDWETIRYMSPHHAYELLRQFRAKRAPISSEEKASIRRNVEGQIALAEAQGALEGHPVRLVPAQVHENFENVLFKAAVPATEAKRTLGLLLTTPEGNDMLKLMVFDAVKIQRSREAKARPPAGEYMGPPTTGG